MHENQRQFLEAMRDALRKMAKGAQGADVMRATCAMDAGRPPNGRPFTFDPLRKE